GPPISPSPGPHGPGYRAQAQGPPISPSPGPHGPGYRAQARGSESCRLLPVPRTLLVLRLLRGDVGDCVPGVMNADEQKEQPRPAFETARQGTLRIAEMSSAAQKWTTVGVPNAPTSGPMERASAPSTTTTNCRPVNAAADEPTMT